MKCDCINRVDNELRKRNLRLTGYTFLLPDLRVVPQVSTAWVDPNQADKGRKRNPPAMLGSHCPFCGLAVEDTLTMSFKWICETAVYCGVQKAWRVLNLNSSTLGAAKHGTELEALNSIKEGEIRFHKQFGRTVRRVRLDDLRQAAFRLCESLRPEAALIPPKAVDEIEQAVLDYEQESGLEATHYRQLTRTASKKKRLEAISLDLRFWENHSHEVGRGLRRTAEQLVMATMRPKRKIVAKEGQTIAQANWWKKDQATTRRKLNLH